MRTYIENYTVIATKDDKNGVLVYSVGKVNNNNDNMYFVDMVKKSFVDYQWLGGGGHINHDNLRKDESYILSVQLLNENQKITPTLFGVILDEKISTVTIKTSEGSSDSVIYNCKDVSEKIYVTQFQNNVSDYPFFMIVITYEDGNKLNYFISSDEITEFQEGQQIYIYKERG